MKKLNVAEKPATVTDSTSNMEVRVRSAILFIEGAQTDMENVKNEICNGIQKNGASELGWMEERSVDLLKAEFCSAMYRDYLDVKAGNETMDDRECLLMVFEYFADDFRKSLLRYHDTPTSTSMFSNALSVSRTKAKSRLLSYLEMHIARLSDKKD